MLYSNQVCSHRHTTSCTTSCATNREIYNGVWTCRLTGRFEVVKRKDALLSVDVLWAGGCTLKRFNEATFTDDELRRGGLRLNQCTPIRTIYSTLQSSALRSPSNIRLILYRRHHRALVNSRNQGHQRNSLPAIQEEIFIHQKNKR